MKEPINIRPEDLEIVLQILSRHFPSNVAVWVFGSRATGTIKPFSDLDLLIDLEGVPIPSDVTAELASDFEESDLPYKVDIVDQATASDSFLSMIKNSRKRLI